jgi:hypothetical protein
VLLLFGASKTQLHAFMTVANLVFLANQWASGLQEILDFWIAFPISVIAKDFDWF